MLTGSQRRILRQAILAAFEFNSLEQALREGSTSRDLNDLVSPNATFDTMVSQLISRSIDEGWTRTLLQTLLIERANNAYFVGAVKPIADEIQDPVIADPGRKILSRRNMIAAGAALSASAIGAYTALRIWRPTDSPRAVNRSANATRTLTGSDGSVSSVAFVGNDRVLSAGWDQMLRVWDLSNEPAAEPRRHEAHSGVVWCVATLPDGVRAISAGEDQVIQLWDLKSLRPLRKFAEHEGPVWSIAPCPDGKRAISGSLDTTLKLWDLSAPNSIKTLRSDAEIRSVAAGRDGTIAVSAAKGAMISWDFDAGKQLRRFDGHEGNVNAVAITSDNRVISAGDDSTIRVWDLVSANPILKFTKSDGHAGRILSVAVSHDNRFALSGGYDQTARLWDLSNGTLIKKFEGHREPVEAVAIAPNGLIAVTGSRDKTIKVWELPKS